MLAIVKLAGSQYTVRMGDIISVNKLDAQAGETVVISEVLTLIDGENVELGTPILDGRSVSAVVLEHFKAKKVLVFKKKRRKNYQKMTGHRHQLSKIQISEIN